MAVRLLEIIRKLSPVGKSTTKQELLRRIEEILADRLGDRYRSLSQETAIQLVTKVSGKTGRLLKDESVLIALSESFKHEINQLKSRWKLDDSRICAFLLKASVAELEAAFEGRSLSLADERYIVRWTSVMPDPIEETKRRIKKRLAETEQRAAMAARQSSIILTAQAAGLDIEIGETMALYLAQTVSIEEIQLLSEDLRDLSVGLACAVVKNNAREPEPIELMRKSARYEKAVKARVRHLSETRPMVSRKKGGSRPFTSLILALFLSQYYHPNIRCTIDANRTLARCAHHRKELRAAG
ncbi:MAG: hypothetical protein C5B51_13690 [Terriglobia bacterium]|nr:MAG: hypothetical protein C5B51_13690 [Terriglobia bacterium]